MYKINNDGSSPWNNWNAIGYDSQHIRTQLIMFPTLAWCI